MTGPTFALALAATLAAFLTARVEEKDCLAKFGEDYQEYMSPSKMFIPNAF